MSSTSNSGTDWLASVDRLISIADAAKLVGISRAGYYRGVKEGYLPAPVQITRRRVGFRLSTIREFIETRPAAQIRIELVALQTAPLKRGPGRPRKNPLPLAA